MEQLSENLYSFDVPLKGSPLRSINCYLLRGSERNLLIDTAFNSDESEREVLRQMAELALSPENTDIFLTHMHVDHSGLIARLKRPENTIYASAKDKKLVDGFQNPQHWSWITASNRYAGVPADKALRAESHVAYANRPAHSVEISVVEAGDFLSVGGYHLEVIDLAGHTPGQIGLWDAEKGFLFCGDHILDKISPNITAWDLETDYLKIFCSNLEKVRAMPVKRLFPAHRKVPADLNGRIDELLAHHQNRLEIIKTLLGRMGRPATSYEIARQVEWSTGKDFETLPIQQQWFACSETLAHLQRLWFDGAVTCTVDADECRWFSLPSATDLGHSA